MALLYTWSSILTKIQNDCGLTQEPFVSPTELLGYANEAIEAAETAIHTFGIEGAYFNTFDWMTLVAGTTLYNFPTDIYSNKLRKLFYNSGGPAGLAAGSGTRRYEVRQIRSLNDTQYFSSGDDYRFLIVNQQIESGGNQIQMWPQPITESGQVIQRFYIREVRRLTSSLIDVNNVCEINECVNFLFAHMKWNIAKKRRGSPEMVTDAKADRDTEYAVLQATLREMVPDGNNLVAADMSAYMGQEVDRYYS